MKLRNLTFFKKGLLLIWPQLKAKKKKKVLKNKSDAIIKNFGEVQNQFSSFTWTATGGIISKRNSSIVCGFWPMCCECYHVTVHETIYGKFLYSQVQMFGRHCSIIPLWRKTTFCSYWRRKMKRDICPLFLSIATISFTLYFLRVFALLTWPSENYVLYQICPLHPWCLCRSSRYADGQLYLYWKGKWVCDHLISVTNDTGSLTLPVAWFFPHLNQGCLPSGNSVISTISDSRNSMWNTFCLWYQLGNFFFLFTAVFFSCSLMSPYVCWKFLLKNS